MTQYLHSVFWVGLGGALGATARHSVNLWLAPYGGSFAWHTLLVNTLGSLLAGLAAGWWYSRVSSPGPWQWLLLTGGLGAFTTFSAFSIDVLNLAMNQRWLLAMGFVLANLCGAVLAVAAGWMLGRAL